MDYCLQDSSSQASRREGSLNSLVCHCTSCTLLYLVLQECKQKLCGLPVWVASSYWLSSCLAIERLWLLMLFHHSVCFHQTFRPNWFGLKNPTSTQNSSIWLWQRQFSGIFWNNGKLQVKGIWNIWRKVYKWCPGEPQLMIKLAAFPQENWIIFWTSYNCMQVTINIVSYIFFQKDATVWRKPSEEFSGYL